MHRRVDTVSALALAAALAGCAGPRGTPDDAPTLASLATRRAELPPDTGVRASLEQIIAAYRDYLAATPHSPQRAMALRRMGDLEMARADQQLADSPGGAAPAAPAAGAPDYRAAIARYQEVLKAYPRHPDNDRVLYQLARAQEQGGSLETALHTLDRLVREHPATRLLGEAQFRRGELLFTLRDYPRAEAAYTAVLATTADSPYRLRARYMQGWSQFKQGRLEQALQAFFVVLDASLGGADARQPDPLAGLPRAERELVDDTLRVTSLSLQALQGAETIAAHTATGPRQGYEPLVYRRLAELYQHQQRPKDAADTLAAFTARRPLHAQAPLLQAQVIAIHEDAGFDSLALQAKQDFVARYGADSSFRRDNPAGWAAARPLLKAHLAALASHFHAQAQQGRATPGPQATAASAQAAAAATQAVRWYRAWLAAFAGEPEAPAQRFLLAELLTDTGQHAAAALEYEHCAYRDPPHPRSADAGYAAVLARDSAQRGSAAADTPRAQRDAVASALRFAEHFASDPRAAQVQGHAADTLFALGEAERAAAVAQQLLDRQPPAADAQRRVAWTVLGHLAFEAGRFAQAEPAYRELLALADAAGPGTPALPAAARQAVQERLAAAVYRQGEAARGAGQAQAAAAHFERVATLAPQSSVRAAAQFDAAATRIGLGDWPAAITLLEDFRRRFPGHALQADVGAKLALAYLESRRFGPAAAEFERLAAAAPDDDSARAALWQAATLHEQAGDRRAAATAYQRYLARYAAPLAPAVEARHRLAALAQAEHDAAGTQRWQRALVQAEAQGGAERTPRTRALAAAAALALAEPLAQAVAQVALVEPLKKQLALKSTRLQAALKAYAAIGELGDAEAGSAAAFHSAALYQGFARDLLASQRPKRLSKAELAQYEVLLEEQAFPFEEQAIAQHEANARRAAEGQFDAWVQRSYAALAALRPARYRRAERDDACASPAAAEAQRRGLAARREGRFEAARVAYEQALAAEPGCAAALLNLAILHELYLWDAAQALPLYERWLTLAAGSPAAAGPHTEVGRWVADLKNRKPAPRLLSRKDPR
ncbi:MAG: tetratricopeptide repeat protein [Burkholderiales bacterium]|nr:tetratricopeptide repeat protein [Burkholderiales bacterium]